MIKRYLFCTEVRVTPGLPKYHRHLLKERKRKINLLSKQIWPKMLETFRSRVHTFSDLLVKRIYLIIRYTKKPPICKKPN